MSQEWYDYPITQAHGQQAGGSTFGWESGIDLGTPNDTPVYFPWNCTVIDASFYTFGGQVACQVDGNPNLTTYFIHLDQIYVKPGEDIQAGETIGLTGGGLGDNVLHDGRVQPAQSQSWFVESDGSLASTGYHTEFGEFIASNMQQFNADWNNHNNQLDPTQTIQELMQSGIGGASQPQPKTGNCQVPLWCWGLPTPISALIPQCNCNGANPGGQFVSGAISSQVSGPLTQILFGLLGGILIVVGLVGMTHAETVVQTVGKAALL